MFWNKKKQQRLDLLEVKCKILERDLAYARQERDEAEQFYKRELNQQMNFICTGKREQDVVNYS